IRRASGHAGNRDGLAQRSADRTPARPASAASVSAAHDGVLRGLVGATAGLFHAGADMSTAGDRLPGKVTCLPGSAPAAVAGTDGEERLLEGRNRLPEQWTCSASLTMLPPLAQCAPLRARSQRPNPM